MSRKPRHGVSDPIPAGRNGSIEKRVTGACIDGGDHGGWVINSTGVRCAKCGADTDIPAPSPTQALWREQQKELKAEEARRTLPPPPEPKKLDLSVGTEQIPGPRRVRGDGGRGSPWRTPATHWPSGHQNWPNPFHTLDEKRRFFADAESIARAYPFVVAPAKQSLIQSRFAQVLDDSRSSIDALNELNRVLALADKTSLEMAMDEAIRAVFDDAEIAKIKAPNINEIAAGAKRRLESKGFDVSEKMIKTRADAVPEFRDRRRKQGRTLRSEQLARARRETAKP
jgi:hypothetical protein